MTLFAFGFTPTPFQIIFVLAVGVLIFGKNLPDVAKQIGAAIGTLRKGISEMGDLSNLSKGGTSRRTSSTEEDLERTVPVEKHRTVGTKFVPPEES